VACINTPDEVMGISSFRTTMSIESYAAELKSALRQFPNFPSEGILFEDFLPIFAKPELFQKLVDAFKLHVGDTKVDYVVGLESRGFLFGPTLALALGAGFIPVRKPGKLPGQTLEATFQKEYGTDKFQIQEGVIPKGARVLVVDDILATGGSASAAGLLVEKSGAQVVEYLFVMELDFLKGRDKLNSAVFTLLSGQESKLE
jgi:adenine phosphoribosyltransferase